MNIPTWNTKESMSGLEFAKNLATCFIVPLLAGMTIGFVAALAGADPMTSAPAIILAVVIGLYFWIALWCGVHRRVRDSGAPTHTTAIGFVCSLLFAPLAILLWLVLCFAKTGQFGEPITEGSSTDQRESTPMATKFNRPA